MGDEAKFRELLLYVAKRLESDQTGGATKVNKVLFFSEFAHVRRHGRPITGVEYQKLPWGPAPRRLKPVRDGLIAAGEARLEQEPFLGQMQQRIVPLRDPDLSALDEDELATVESVIDQLWGMTATQVSALSHEEVGWQMVDENDTIPYESAYLRPAILTNRIRQHAAELARARQS